MIPPENLVFIDETGMDQKPYAFGWGRKGVRVNGKKTGARIQRISLLAALLKGALVAKHLFLGTCNRTVFLEWLRHHLLPTLSRGFTLVMDNARFHHAKEITELVQAAGCRILYLPPYSPELNPIEQAWYPLKNTARKYMRNLSVNSHDAMRMAIL